MSKRPDFFDICNDADRIDKMEPYALKEASRRLHMKEPSDTYYLCVFGSFMLFIDFIVRFDVWVYAFKVNFLN